MADRNEGARFEANPIERVRDLIEANRNYFPELETAAEKLRDELNVPAEGLFASLSTRLRERHSIVTRIMPVDVMRETLRRFDRHRRQLLISELVDGAGRSFQLALQIGLAECGTIIETIVNRRPLDDTPRRLYRSRHELFRGRLHDALSGIPRRGRSAGLRRACRRSFNAGFRNRIHRPTTL
jgi:predicted transcriptional regulator